MTKPYFLIFTSNFNLKAFNYLKFSLYTTSKVKK
jgi:hypothetical protein